MEYYSALKKKEILSSLTILINSEGIILSKISKTETKLSGITYMWHLKKKKS